MLVSGYFTALNLNRVDFTLTIVQTEYISIGVDTSTLCLPSCTQEHLSRLLRVVCAHMSALHTTKPELSINCLFWLKLFKLFNCLFIFDLFYLYLFIFGNWVFVSASIRNTMYSVPHAVIFWLFCCQNFTYFFFLYSLIFSPTN